MAIQKESMTLIRLLPWMVYRCINLFIFHRISKDTHHRYPYFQTIHYIFQIIMVTYCFNIDFILLDLIQFLSVVFVSFLFDFDLFYFISVDFALVSFWLYFVLHFTGTHLGGLYC